MGGFGLTTEVLQRWASSASDWNGIFIGKMMLFIFCTSGRATLPRFRSTILISEEIPDPRRWPTSRDRDRYPGIPPRIYNAIRCRREIILSFSCSAILFRSSCCSAEVAAKVINAREYPKHKGRTSLCSRSVEGLKPFRAVHFFPKVTTVIPRSGWSGGSVRGMFRFRRPLHCMQL